MSIRSTRFSKKLLPRNLSPVGLAVMIVAIVLAQAFAENDALPSWNDTATK